MKLHSARPQARATSHTNVAQPVPCHTGVFKLLNSKQRPPAKQCRCYRRCSGTPLACLPVRYIPAPSPYDTLIRRARHANASSPSDAATHIREDAKTLLSATLLLRMQRISIIIHSYYILYTRAILYTRTITYSHVLYCVYESTSDVLCHLGNRNIMDLAPFMRAYGSYCKTASATSRYTVRSLRTRLLSGAMLYSSYRARIHASEVRPCYVRACHWHIDRTCGILYLGVWHGVHCLVQVRSTSASVS